MQELVNFIYLITAAQGLFLVVLLLLHKKNNRAIRILALYLLILSLELFSSFLWGRRDEQAGLDFALKFFMIIEPLGYLSGPLFYCYILFFCKMKERFILIDILHTIPFFIYLYSGIDFLLEPIASQEKFVAQMFAGEIPDYIKIVPMLPPLHFLIYLIISLKAVNRYRKSLEELLSSQKRSFLWLYIIILIALIIFTGELTAIAVHMHQEINQLFYHLLSFTIVVFIYYVAVKSFLERESLAPLPRSTPGEKQKYGDIRLEKSKCEEDFAKIKRLIESDKLYLDSDFSIAELAEKSGIKSHWLSQIINLVTGNNFYYLINNYRVEYAKRLLNKEEFPDYTIIRVAYDAGFGSKGTFNSVFKKYTKQTPSQYRLHIIVEKQMNNRY